MKKKFFFSIWNYLDFTYIVSNLLLVTQLILYMWAVSFLSFSKFRILESLISIVIVLKMLYYMLLVEQIAPLIELIFLILKKILWFMVVFILFIFAFSVAIYLIG